MSLSLASLLDVDPALTSRPWPGGVLTATVDQRRLPAITDEFARARDARLADLFATERDRDPTVDLRVIYAFDRDDRYVMLRCPVDGHLFPALSDLDPAAFVEECEIYEQIGIRPDNLKPLNRVHMAPNVQTTFTRLRPRQRERLSHQHAPHTIQGEAFEFPFGPIRAVGWESLYTGLVTTGEEILDVYLFHWHKHRATERRLAGATVERAVWLAERVEGLSAVANATALCHAVESAAGVAVCEQGARIRCIVLELERIYNHAAAIAMLCQTTGLAVGQADTEIVLERLLRCHAAAFGHRYLFGVVCPGGVRRPPDAEPLRAELTAACRELERLAAALLRTNSFVDRLEATGTITAEHVDRLGLVGPVARATGVAIDVRADHPQAPYAELAIEPATADGGDALARMRVMCAEIAGSLEIVLAQLDAIEPDRPVVTEFDPATVAGRDGLGWAESPRGETICWLSFDAVGRVAWARLRPGSARNWRAFDEAARSSNVFTDVPIIEASFWLTVAGAAR